MEILDIGHEYKLQVLDGNADVKLQFVKREGDKYPGNIGTASGTTCQEVIRVLISRVKYLDAQISSDINLSILYNLREALMLFEHRAADRHGRILPLFFESSIEDIETCKICGHIFCEEHNG